MNPDSYRRACRIAERACIGWRLSAEDWEEVKQDAAIAAWRTGLDSSTRVFWAARDSARTIQGQRRKGQLRIVANDGTEWRKASAVDVEAEVVGRLTADQMLAGLPDIERVAVEETVLNDRKQQDVADECGVDDSTITRRRERGLRRLQNQIEETE